MLNILLKRKIVFSISLIFISFVPTHIAQAQDSTALRSCINGLLYTAIDSSGNQAWGAGRTVLPESAAVDLCQGVQSGSSALEVRRCANGLLYTSIDSSGNKAWGAGRTSLSIDNVVTACRQNHNTIAVENRDQELDLLRLEINRLNRDVIELQAAYRNLILELQSLRNSHSN